MDPVAGTRTRSNEIVESDRVPFRSGREGKVRRCSAFFAIYEQLKFMKIFSRRNLCQGGARPRELSEIVVIHLKIYIYIYIRRYRNP